MALIEWNWGKEGKPEPLVAFGSTASFRYPKSDCVGNNTAVTVHRNKLNRR
jgi:hypothetical protein